MSREMAMIMAADGGGGGGGGGEGALEDNLRNPGGGPIGCFPPSWKLYDNPFYYYYHHHHHHLHREHPVNFPARRPYNPPRGRSAVSAPKLTAFFRDSAATLFQHMGTNAGGRPAPGSELHLARARIRELRAELELERRLRKKAEALSRVLAREATEERERRESLEEELARAGDEAYELRRAVEEERRMMRVAAALREERVQMKLADARVLMEEKLLELRSSSPVAEEKVGDRRLSSPAEEDGCAEADGGARGGGGAGRQIRKEAENPHIRRGIRGSVEFPRTGRIRVGSGFGPGGGVGDPGPKPECQLALRRVLPKHRVPGSSGTVNLVM